MQATHALPSASRPKSVSLSSSLARLRSGLWLFLGVIGERRARVELARLAREYRETRPELAAQLQAASRGGWL